MVKIDGEPIRKKQASVYLAFNKPKGVTCTTDLKDKTNHYQPTKIKKAIFIG